MRKYFSDGIFAIVFVLSIGYYYLGDLRFLATIIYLLGLNVIIIRSLLYMSINERIFSGIVLIILGFLVSVIVFEKLTNAILSLRLFFGFIFIYALLRHIISFNPKFVILCFGIITILEYILIRAHPDLIFWLNNYDDGNTFYLWHTQTLLGGVHSFGGNRTVNGVLMLALHIYARDTLKSRFVSWVSLFAMVISVSGTAYGLYFVYLCIQMLKYRQSLFLMCFMSPVVIFMFFYTGDDEYFFQQFSYHYYAFIFEAKIEQVRMFLDSGNIWLGSGSLAIGAKSEINGYDATFGDFMMLELIKRHGLLGFIILVMVLAGLVRKQSALPVLMIFLGSTHYHVLFSGPGQFITAWLLALGGQVSSNRILKCDVDKSKTHI